jgi:hypothetical protein
MLNGSRGGKRRLETMTADERSEIARKAAAKSAEVRSKKADLVGKMSPSKQRWSLLAHRGSHYQISRTRLQQIPLRTAMEDSTPSRFNGGSIRSTNPPQFAVTSRKRLGLPTAGKAFNALFTHYRTPVPLYRVENKQIWLHLRAKS